MATAVAVGDLEATASVGGAIKPVTFSLDATKAVLTVTATTSSVRYGQPIKLFYAITGFVNGDTLKVVSGTPTETTTAKDGSAPGEYPITIARGSLTTANYTFTFVNGTLTITPLGMVAGPSGSETVTIAEATSGATVYYTLDGKTPTTSSAKYTGSITVTKTTTLEFIAVKAGYTTSPVRTVIITVK
jgi:hypothetical protein